MTLDSVPEVPAPQSQHNRLPWIVAGVVVTIAVLYFVPGLFIAYTEDAYVHTDFVEIAPEVAGVIDHVDIANDQKVEVGAALAGIDPKPFQLAVDLSQKRIDGTLSAAKVKQTNPARSSPNLTLRRRRSPSHRKNTTGPPRS